MKNRLPQFYALSIFAACLLCACTTLPDYGALGPADGNSQVNIADLEAGWERYDIYYNTWYTATPAALMFDPRDNATTLTGNSWIRVTEAAAFADHMQRVSGKHEFTRIWAIVGPQKQLLGYMITPTTKLYIKMIDEKTFYVSNLQVPPSGP